MHFMYMVLCLHVHLNTRRGHKATMRCHVGSGTELRPTEPFLQPCQYLLKRGGGGEVARTSSLISLEAFSYGHTW